MLDHFALDVLKSQVVAKNALDNDDHSILENNVCLQDTNKKKIGLHTMSE